MEFVLNEYHRNVPVEDLIEDMKRVAGIHQKSSITQKEYLQYGKYASRTIVMRFGSWNEALKKRDWFLKEDILKHICIVSQTMTSLKMSEPLRANWGEIMFRLKNTPSMASIHMAQK